MTTTVQNLVDRVYTRLQTKVSRNKLDTAVDADDIAFSFTYGLDRIQPGAKLSVGLEDCGVWEIDDSAGTATVQRGDFGSTGATHAVGDVVLVDAPYTPFGIVTAMNTELASLPGEGVSQYKAVELTTSATKVGYDLAGVTDLLRVHQVSVRELGSEERWTVLPKNVWSVQQEAETDQFPSGEALMVYVGLPPGRQLRVIYQAPFVPVSALATNIETTAGLQEEFADILVVGACWRLLGGRPAERTDSSSQPDTRRAEEVAPSDQIRATQPFFMERAALISAARRQQIKKYGL